MAEHLLCVRLCIVVLSRVLGVRVCGAQGVKYFLRGHFRSLGAWIVVRDEDVVIAPGVVKCQCSLERLLVGVHRGYCLQDSG